MTTSVLVDAIVHRLLWSVAKFVGNFFSTLGEKISKSSGFWEIGVVFELRDFSSVSLTEAEDDLEASCVKSRKKGSLSYCNKFYEGWVKFMVFSLFFSSCIIYGYLVGNKF